jgi:hypothetical protein
MGYLLRANAETNSSRAVACETNHTLRIYFFLKTYFIVWYTPSKAKYKGKMVKENWFIWLKIWTKYINFIWQIFPYILRQREYNFFIYLYWIQLYYLNTKHPQYKYNTNNVHVFFFLFSIPALSSPTHCSSSRPATRTIVLVLLAHHHPPSLTTTTISPRPKPTRLIRP